jgi:hypothetical protein
LARHGALHEVLDERSGRVCAPDDGQLDEVESLTQGQRHGLRRRACGRGLRGKGDAESAGDHCESGSRSISQVDQQRRAEFIPSTLETAKNEGEFWALPHNSYAAPATVAEPLR